MEIKRLLRISLVILVVVMLTASLSACRLPASTGPEGETTEESPAPGGDAEISAIELAATATAQAGGSSTAGGDTTQPVIVMTETPVPVPPTKTPPAYVQPTPGIPSTYVLKYGEFPFCIARRFNVNQYELLSINGLGVNSATYVGMTLKIPQTGNQFDGQVWLKTHPAEYKVKAGETLEIIACKFGNVSPDMIALQNNLAAPYTLNVGQVLVIP